MSKQSTKRSGHSNGRKSRASNQRLDRPFDPALWKKAKRVAGTYTLVITPEPDVGYFGRTVEMPLVMGDGPTHAECAAQVLEATTLAVASMLEAGETPPVAAREGKRNQQVNLRLTADEKLRLQEAARREGFRTISDFIRSAALGRTG